MQTELTPVEIRANLAYLRVMREDLNFKISFTFGTFWTLVVAIVLGQALLPYFESLQYMLPIIIIVCTIELILVLIIFITGFIAGLKGDQKYLNNGFIKAVNYTFSFSFPLVVLGITIYYIVMFAIYIQNNGGADSTLDILFDLLEFTK